MPEQLIHTRGRERSHQIGQCDIKKLPGIRTDNGPRAAPGPHLSQKVMYMPDKPLEGVCLRFIKGNPRVRAFATFLLQGKMRI